MASIVTQHLVEALIQPTGAARIGQDVVEVLFAAGTLTTGSLTGCGVSQHSVEVLVGMTHPASVSQHIVEFLYLPKDAAPGAAAGGQTSYGFAT